jgi:arylsulfatase A-like enzyme
MKREISRREFLKLMTLVPPSLALPKAIFYQGDTEKKNDQENILIVVFDAWSASNISLHGYPRQTTPHLNQLASRAVVYHNHFAGGHYTPPGTASLLTGTYPWTHHAFTFAPVLKKEFLKKNIFHAFPHYYRFAYSHNFLVHHLLHQFKGDLDDLLRWEKLYFEQNPVLSLFRKDEDIASISWDRAMRLLKDGFAYSLFLSNIYERVKSKNIEQYLDQFPRGVPSRDEDMYFTLEQGIDGLYDLTQTVSQPFLGYYHFLPPHAPYNTHRVYFNAFKGDGYIPTNKPQRIFKDISDNNPQVQRRWYDEFILYVDAEFGRLYHQLENSGVLENTWIILTSDHGEMFERGFKGHTSPVFYQPIINIPLIIFPPGQKERIDIYDNTSAVDVLPTLLKITDQEIPSWIEGVVLPPFADYVTSENRAITSVQVEGVKGGEVTAASAMCIRDRYKATWYFGYDNLKTGDEFIELYDITADPEEMNDLYSLQKDIADDLVDVLRSKIIELGHTKR